MVPAQHVAAHAYQARRIRCSNAVSSCVQANDHCLHMGMRREQYLDDKVRLVVVDDIDRSKRLRARL